MIFHSEKVKDNLINALREDKVLNEYVLVKFMKMFYMPLESEFDEIEYVID